MLSVLALAASIGANFAHPTPTPPADLPVAVYAQRRARVLGELGDCVALISSQGAVTGESEDYRQDADFYEAEGPGAGALDRTARSDLARVTAEVWG